MATLAEIRSQYPQYQDMSDTKLADALYTKFYTDIPREQFNEKVGLKPEKNFGERLQSVMDNPTPGGAFHAANFIKDAVTGTVQSSIDSMSQPSTEEDFFRQRIGQEQGPQHAIKAASIVTPTAPAGGLLARSLATAPAALAPKAIPAASPLLESAKSIGVGIPKYLETESMPIQRVAAGLRNVPGAGDRIVKSAQAVNDELGVAAKTAAEGFGAGSVDVAGGVAKDSLTKWVKSDSNKPINNAYKEVDALVNNEIIHPLENTANEVAKIMAERANAKITGKSAAVDTLLPAIQSEGMNYTGLKDLRSHLGDKTPQEMIASGINPKEAKRLYGPLTRDLEAIVEKAGGENALSKWKEANTLASLTAGQRKQLSKVIGAKGDATPEAVYSRLVSYAGSKSSGDINRLMLARKAMGEDAWSEVASAAISKLGRDAQGNFSPDRYVTAFGNLSTAGKNTLFGGNNGHAKALEDINTVSAAIKDKIGKFSNPSGTAQNLMGGGLIAAVLHEPITLIASLVGGRILSEILSKPVTAKATADFAKAYEAAVIKPSESRNSMLQIASGGLARAIGSNIKNVDVQTFLKQLQGSVPATAKDDPKQRSKGRDDKPYANAVNGKS